MTDYVFLALLFVHVGAVVVWFGSVVFVNMVLGPMSSRLSPQGQADLGMIVVPRATRFLMMMGGVALLAGAILYGYITEVNKAYAPSSSGLPWIQASAAVALIGFIVGILMIGPASRKLKAVIGEAKEKGTSPAELFSKPTGEIARLQRRLLISGLASIVLLTLVLLFMIVGANL